MDKTIAVYHQFLILSVLKVGEILLRLSALVG